MGFVWSTRNRYEHDKEICVWHKDPKFRTNLAKILSVSENELPEFKGSPIVFFRKASGDKKDSYGIRFLDMGGMKSPGHSMHKDGYYDDVEISRLNLEISCNRSSGTKTFVWDGPVRIRSEIDSWLGFDPKTGAPYNGLDLQKDLPSILGGLVKFIRREDIVIGYENTISVLSLNLGSGESIKIAMEVFGEYRLLKLIAYKKSSIMPQADKNSSQWRRIDVNPGRSEIIIEGSKIVIDSQVSFFDLVQRVISDKHPLNLEIQDLASTPA